MQKQGGNAIYRKTVNRLISTTEIMFKNVV